MRLRRLPCLLFAVSVAARAAAASDRPLKSLGGTLGPTAENSGLLFVVGGDNRPTGKGAPIPRLTRTIFQEIGWIRPDFVLWTGDILYGYGDSPPELDREYRKFQALAAQAGVPLFNAPGNHEIHRTDDTPCSSPRTSGFELDAQFLRHFGNLYGSFDAGGAHFIALDTETYCQEDSIEGPQLEWLQRDLEEHRNAAAIFVFSHTEFFSSPQIDPPALRGHEALRNRDELHALFRKYPVRAVFSGHEHLYWHEAHDGIDYFVAGGGGAPLYAPPDRGGFGHYIVVSMSSSGIRYDVVEPGRLGVESAGSARNGKKFWVVNSNDADIPLRGVSVDLPRLGPCSGVTAQSELRDRNGALAPIPLSRLSCSSAKGRLRVTLGLKAPRGTSVPITVRAK
ncbi:MAG: metallophosphoesterase family protein [Thermoanaerobaculia bacterium]